MRDPAVSSPDTVDWRVRKNIIDYLEFAASFEAQNKYQAAVPLVHVPYEVINQWEDWVHSRDDLDYRGLPAYSREEIEALKTYQLIWEEVVAATPNPLPDFNELHRSAEWLRLAAAAQAALNVMTVRGPFPPERPIDPGD